MEMIFLDSMTMTNWMQSPPIKNGLAMVPMKRVTLVIMKVKYLCAM